MEPTIRYTVEEAAIQADGKHVRLISRHDGRLRPDDPRHIQTMRLDQARQLRDDLDELIAALSSGGEQ